MVFLCLFCCLGYQKPPLVDQKPLSRQALDKDRKSCLEKTKTPPFLQELAIVKGEFRAASCDFAGAIISGIGQDDGDFDAGASKERSKLSELGITPVALLPYRDELYKQTVAEVRENTHRLHHLYT